VNPQQFHVLESFAGRLDTRVIEFHRFLFAPSVGKKGSQDSSTCDINTMSRVLEREFITSYDVLDSFPQMLST